MPVHVQLLWPQLVQLRWLSYSFPALSSTHNLRRTTVRIAAATADGPVAWTILFVSLVPTNCRSFCLSSGASLDKVRVSISCNEAVGISVSFLVSHHKQNQSCMPVGLHRGGSIRHVGDMPYDVSALQHGFVRHRVSVVGISAFRHASTDVTLCRHILAYFDACQSLSHVVVKGQSQSFTVCSVPAQCRTELFWCTLCQMLLARSVLAVVSPVSIPTWTGRQR